MPSKATSKRTTVSPSTRKLYVLEPTQALCTKDALTCGRVQDGFRSSKQCKTLWVP